MKKLIILICICCLTLSMGAQGVDKEEFETLKKEVEILKEKGIKNQEKLVTAEEKFSSLHWWEFLIIATIISLIGLVYKKLIDQKLKNLGSATEIKFKNELAEFEISSKKRLADHEIEMKKELAEQEISVQKNLNDIENGFQKLLNEKQDIIDRTFNLARSELRLWKEKKILVYGESDMHIILQVLRRAGFNIADNLFEDEEEASKEGYDIFLINNYLGNVNLEEALEKVQKLPKTVLVFYYTSRFEPPYRFPTRLIEESQQDKINFANSASQIYGNLLNTLKYQDKIKNDEITK